MIEALLLLSVIVMLLYYSMKKPEGYPPGPVGLPLAGYFPFVNQGDPHSTWNQLGVKYGPVVGVKMAYQYVVFVSGWKAVREAFMNDDLNGRPEICFNRDRSNGMNYGVIFLEGDALKSQKRFILHHFRNLGFGKRSQENVILQEAEDLIKEFSEAPGSVETELAIGVTALNISWSLIGGTRFQRSDSVLPSFYHNVNALMHTIPVSGTVCMAYPYLRYLIPETSGYNRIKQAGISTRALINKTIKEHKDTLDPDNPRDFIDLYLNEIEAIDVKSASVSNNYNGDDSNGLDVNAYFNEDQLQTLCVDILVASSDTTAAVVSFGILLLCLNPALQDRIHEELDAHVPQNRLPSLDDRPRLVLTDATVTEVMRYRNPAPITMPHRSVCDTTLLGYKIPRDTVLLISLRSVLMEKDYWGDPEVFRPDRFINEDGTLRRDPRMIPFGKGKRVCLGESLARISSFLLFASLIQKFKFSLPPGEPIPDTEGIAVFTLAPPLHRVVLTPRF